MEITVEARSTTVAADKKSSSRKRKLGSAESAAAATVVKEGRTTQRSQMRRTAGGVSTIVFPKRVNEAERASLTAQYAPLMRAMFHMGFTGDVYAHQASCAELAQAACFYGSTAPDTTPTFAIFHEMGLGKTVSAIIAYAYMVFTVSRTLLRVNNGSTDGSGGGGSALDGTAIKGDSESTLKILEGVASYSSPSTLLPSTSTSASISASLQRALASAHAELRGEDLLRDGPVSPEELAAARRYAPLLTRPLLIIVPTSVLSSWLSSCHRFLPSWCTPDTCVTAYGKEEVRRTLEDADRQDTELRVVITTYKMVQTHGEAFSRVYWSGFVLDEVHCLRSPTTDTFRAVRRVLEVARDRPRLALTGTPVNNSAEDLRVIAGLLGVPSLAHLLSHRLLKADVLDLPPVRHRYFAYVISELQREAYEILLEAVNRAHRFYSRMLRAQPRVHALCEAARNWYVSEVANLQMACLHLSLVRGRLLSTRLAPKLLSSEGAARLAALTAFPAPSLPDPDGTKDTCAVDTTEGSCAPVKCSMRVTEEDDIVTIVGGDRKGAPAPVAAESESEYSDESHSQREGAESGEREEVRLRDRLLGALKSGSDDGIEGEGGGGGGGGRGECKRSILDDTLERYWTGEAVDVDSESAEAESEMVISLMHIIRHHFTKPTSKQRGLVITSQWVKVLRGVIAPVVRKYFQRFLNMELLDGSVTARKRGEIVERFQNGSTHILLLSMSIAQGITLTRGTRMVFVSAWGNPQVHLQAQDRLHRIGQDASVTVINMMATMSVPFAPLAARGWMRPTDDEVDEVAMATVNVDATKLEGPKDSMSGTGVPAALSAADGICASLTAACVAFGALPVANATACAATATRRDGDDMVGVHTVHHAIYSIHQEKIRMAKACFASPTSLELTTEKDVGVLHRYITKAFITPVLDREKSTLAEDESDGEMYDSSECQF